MRCLTCGKMLNGQDECDCWVIDLWDDYEAYLQWLHEKELPCVTGPSISA